MLISEAFASWTAANEEFGADHDDAVAMSEDWNNYTDALCKGGELTGLQYHYAPAYDDPMPGDADAEREFLLDAMGVKLESKPAPAPAGNEWGEGSTHWTVTLSRGAESLTVPFHMGKDITGLPQRDDVLHCLLMDRSAIEAADTFEDWAEECGADPDSRAAEAMYERTKPVSAQLERMFSDIDFDDLEAAFEDF